MTQHCSPVNRIILNSISSGPEYSDSSEAYHTGNNSSLSEAAAR